MTAVCSQSRIHVPVSMVSRRCTLNSKSVLFLHACIRTNAMQVCACHAHRQNFLHVSSVSLRGHVQKLPWIVQVFSMRSNIDSRISITRQYRHNNIHCTITGSRGIFKIDIVLRVTFTGILHTCAHVMHENNRMFAHTVRLLAVSGRLGASASHSHSHCVHLSFSQNP
jgi:hypothetical protein